MTWCCLPQCVCCLLVVEIWKTRVVHISFSFLWGVRNQTSLKLYHLQMFSSFCLSICSIVCIEETGVVVYSNALWRVVECTAYSQHSIDVRGKMCTAQHEEFKKRREQNNPYNIYTQGQDHRCPASVKAWE